MSSSSKIEKLPSSYSSESAEWKVLHEKKNGKRSFSSFDSVKFVTTLYHSRGSFHTAQRPSAFEVAFICLFLNRIFISVQISFAHWSKLVS